MEHKTETSMSERVLGTIEEKGIAPKPAWHFMLREWVVWLIATISLVLGSVATALTIYIADASRFIERQIERSSLDTLFSIVPVVWLLLLGVGIFYTVHALHETRHGYRWHTAWLVGFALGLSVAIGYGVHAAGVGASIDRYLISEMPLYKPLTGFHPMHWQRPESGVVAGVIEEVEGGKVTIRTVAGEELTVHTTQQTRVLQQGELREGMHVRVIGTTTDEELFTAEEVAPFRGRGGGMRQHRPVPRGIHMMSGGKRR